MLKNNLKIDTLLNHIKSGKKPIILVKQLNISKQLLSYYLRTLKEKGIIRKLTKGVWEIVKDNLELSSKRIRGHAFIWIIKLPREIKDWNKREEILTKNSIPFTKTGNTIRIIVKGKKVWLCNKSIIIYEPKSFYATLPVSTRQLAIYELLEEIKVIENTIGINLQGFKFRTKREHYALIKNDLAIQVNKQGEKIHLYDDGEWWGDIDKSYNGDEFEFFKTKSFSGLVNSTGANNYFNSQKNTSWKVTPEFVLNGFNILIKDKEETRKELKEFAIALNRHIPAYEKMGRYAKQLGNAVNKLSKVIERKNIKETELNQTSLFDYG